MHIHLISDATGATLQGLTEAALSQFDLPQVQQKLWPQVRSERQLHKIIEELESFGGIVFYTLVDEYLIRQLEETCHALSIPCIAVMAPILDGLAQSLKQIPKGKPGLQHQLDAFYFARMEAIEFAMSFDDGQNLDGIETADVILVGVSRTSKTPTCIYLAHHGIRAANIPLIREVDFPTHVLSYQKPLFVGLVESADRLLEIRATRMKSKNATFHHGGNTYIDPEQIEQEVQWARKFLKSQNWPIIDVTKRSVEETAAEIMVILQERS
ncbi:MAG: kinase/pyrophosphorylase [Alphaproteobacteria bacterium]|nr:kinase/pyrophosphorylase [Alphaproteobacteria bacterium]